MKRNMITVILFIICCLTVDSALAESIKGKFGITGRIGFLVPADSEGEPRGFNINTDTGFIGGGGFIYGITDNIAAELDITNASFGSDVNTDFNTTNISMGVQYRFLNTSIQHLVPYVGGGLDVLVNDADNGLDIDTVAGVHVAAGVDYFLMKQLALTSEIKGVIAPNADIKESGFKVGEFDPSSFSMTFGVRYFFN